LCSAFSVRGLSGLHPAIIRRLSGIRPAQVFIHLHAQTRESPMTKETFEAILESFPPKSSRSRLEPYAELILELHRRGRAYREIARILSERCDIRTSRSTVNDFVRIRLRRRRNLGKLGAPEPTTRTPNPAPHPKPDLPSKTRIDEDEIQKRIADLKHRPAQTQAAPQLFHYDPDQPLSIPAKPGKS